METLRSHIASEFLPKRPDLAFEADFDRKREAIERAVRSEEFSDTFHLYDERGIRDTAQKLNDAFSWSPGYRNHFAVKALPNPRILSLLRDEGSGADASSLHELELADRSGFRGEETMFTSNNTPAEEFRRAAELGAVINFDDISHVAYFREEVGQLPETACLRYNPGTLKSGNAIIGKPEEAKYGLTEEQLAPAYALLAAGGVERFGLHTMVASNERDQDYFAETALILFEQVKEIERRTGITIEFVNLGGGFGIPYQPEHAPLALQRTADLIETAHLQAFGRSGPRVRTEMGRFVTGPHGVLVTKVRHVMEKHRQYVGVDASMADLMRPGMYDAYHHVTVLGKENAPATETYDVVGSLCENNDKFAVQRKLPPIEPGDVLVVHDTGAHGRAMGFNYNGKLRSGEVLLRSDGELEPIRRAETLDDLDATLLP